MELKVSHFNKISETEKAQEWLLQFNEEDIETARMMLDAIKYVSHQEFTQGLERAITGLIQSDEEHIATYPVITPSSIVSNRNNPFEVQDKNDVYEFGSEDRVGHIINNLSRHFEYLEKSSSKKPEKSSKVLINPIIKTLFEKKVKKIVLVDDLCGSGSRIVKFYKKVIPKLLKRYISAGVFELHIVLYGAMEKGLKKVYHDINYFNKRQDNIHIIFPELSQNHLDAQYMELCLKYYKRYFRITDNNRGLGFKDSLGKIIFEHGCPNNVPEILFRNYNGWNALFPNRSTAKSDLVQGFGENSMGNMENILRVFRQNHLAYQIYKKDFLSNDERLMITIIGLLNRSVNNINEYLLIEKTRYSELIAKMIDLGMIIESSSDNYKITQVGLEILNKFRKNRTVNKKTQFDSLENSYYPLQYGGYSRFGNT